MLKCFPKNSPGLEREAAPDSEPAARGCWPLRNPPLHPGRQLQMETPASYRGSNPRLTQAAAWTTPSNGPNLVVIPRTYALPPHCSFSSSLVSLAHCSVSLLKKRVLSWAPPLPAATVWTTQQPHHPCRQGPPPALPPLLCPECLLAISVSWP